MPSFTKKQQIAILIIGIILMFFFSLSSRSLKGSERQVEYEEIDLEDLSTVSESDDESENDQSEKESVEAESEEIVVYVKGAVKSPGIVSLSLGSRVTDAVEKAGGADSGADFNNINLAKKLEDEEMIHIPYEGEEVFELLEEETSNGSDDNKTSESDKIDINNASKEELKSLSGIGEVTADKIIAHRESNKFSSIEDIMDVSGIGEKKFDAIKDSITTN
jgi:competence protein ComEA